MNEIGTAFVKELSDVSGKPLINPFLVAPVPQAAASTSDRVLEWHKMGIGPPSIVAFKAKGTFRIESIDEKFANLCSLDGKVMSSVDTATFMKACIKGDFKMKRHRSRTTL